MKKFFEYHQTNSGGDFNVDDRLTINVWIEAHDSDEADEAAQRLGIYFDGVAKGEDCECCGDRWSPTDKEGHAVPLVDPYVRKWVEKGEPHTRIFYADGSVDEIIQKASDLWKK